MKKPTEAEEPVHPPAEETSPPPRKRSSRKRTSRVKLDGLTSASDSHQKPFADRKKPGKKQRGGPPSGKMPSKPVPRPAHQPVKRPPSVKK